MFFELFCLEMGLEYAEEHERVFNDTVNPQRTFLCKKTPVFFPFFSYFLRI